MSTRNSTHVTEGQNMDGQPDGARTVGAEQAWSEPEANGVGVGSPQFEQEMRQRRRRARIRGLIRRAVVPLIVIAVILGVILVVRWSNQRSAQDLAASLAAAQQTESSFVPSSSLEALNGDGMVELARNPALILRADPGTGHVELEDRRDGFVWRSRPSDSDLAREESRGTWRRNIESPVVFEHIAQLTELSSRMSNVASTTTELSAFQVEEGARFVFDFPEEAIRIGYEVRLAEDHLRVTVPPQLISDGDVRKLYRYYVLPFFGAARTDLSEGYLLAPDGIGGIIPFDENRRYTESFRGRIYGPDYARDDLARDSQVIERIYFPVFGIQRDGRSMLGVVHRGESTGHIVATPAGLRNGFNFATARFNHRFSYRVIRDLVGSSFTRFSESTNQELREIHYYPHPPTEREGYMVMAELFRGYLRAYRGLSDSASASRPADGDPMADDGSVPLQLTVLGGMETDRFIGTRFVPLAPFDQTVAALEDLAAAGVEDATVTVRHWEGIHEVLDQPDKLPPADALGGSEGLASLVEAAHELGYRVRLAGDYVTGGPNGGFQRLNETAHDLAGSPVELYAEDFEDVYYLRPTFSVERVKSDLEALQPLGIDGLRLHSLAQELSSDYNEIGPLPRQGSMQTYVSFLAEVQGRDVGIALDEPNMYALPYADEVIFSPRRFPHMLSGSRLELIERQVPFLPAALRGTVPYTINYYNVFDRRTDQFLKALEYGANVGFLVTTRSPTELRLTEAVGRERLSSTEIGVLREELLARYRDVQEVAAVTRGRRMVDHRRVSGEVYLSRYDNDSALLVNYGDEAFRYGDGVVEPHGFTLLSGEIAARLGEDAADQRGDQGAARQAVQGEGS